MTATLRPEAVALVERVLSGEMQLVANQVLNRFLKELGRRAELAAPVEVVRYRGGRRERDTLPKWQRLTCHTGGRTFATLALEQGLRPELVMKITEHKSWGQLQALCQHHGRCSKQGISPSLWRGRHSRYSMSKLFQPYINSTPHCEAEESARFYEMPERAE